MIKRTPRTRAYSGRWSRDQDWPWVWTPGAGCRAQRGALLLWGAYRPLSAPLLRFGHGGALFASSYLALVQCAVKGRCNMLERPWAK
eukprot:6574757-Pyramimonas_sp.AAC.1